MATTTTINSEASERDHLPTAAAFTTIVNKHLVNDELENFDLGPYEGPGLNGEPVWHDFIEFEPSRWVVKGAREATIALSVAYPLATFTWAEAWDDRDNDEAGGQSFDYKGGVLVSATTVETVDVDVDPVSVHITEVCTEASLPVMVQLYAALRQRGTVEDSALLQLDAGEVKSAYSALFETQIGEGLDALGQLYAARA